MDAGGLLQIARGIVDKVAMPLAITIGPDGEANARVVQTSKLSDDWTVRFMTDRRSRKAQEIGRAGKMTLAYQCDAPDPTKGLWAAALSRQRNGWQPHLTLPSG
jgi:hypothetical protein